MADVISVPDRDSGGQLLILGAIMLGLIFVGLALVTNSAIFAENLSTRQSDAESSHISSFRSAAVSGVADAIGTSNREGAGDSFVGIRDNRYQPKVDALSGKLENRQSLAGANTGVAPVASRPGTQIADTDEDSSITPRNGTPVNWTLATDVHVRAFELEVSPSEADTVTDQLTGGSGNAFLVRLSASGGPDHEVAVYEDSSTGSTAIEVAVSEVGSGAIRTCRTDGPVANLSLTGRPTVDGSYCPALAPVATTTGTYDVTVENGDRASGTYQLVVDRLDGPTTDEVSLDEQVDRENYGLACSSSRTYYDSTGSSPYSTSAIYSGTVRFRYESQRADTQTTTRVAPEQAGGSLTTPLVRSLSVADSSGGGDTAFTIDWTVEDPNGALHEVTVAVVDRNDSDGLTDTTDLSGAGESASGSLTFTDSNDAGDEYDVTVTVSDGTYSRSRTVRHVADGDGTGCPP